jgi:hypothetical protein
MGAKWGPGGNKGGPLKFIPSKPLMKSRKSQIFLGLLLFVIASVLIYNAFDARGKYLPWPASSIAPW